MPFEQRIDASQGIAFLTFHGEVTEEDVQVAFMVSLSSLEMSPHLLRLVDFTKVTEFNLGTGDAARAAKQVQHRADRLCKGKVAIVAPQDLVFGMSRVFMTLTEDLDYPLAVFRTQAGALSWLEAKSLEGDSVLWSSPQAGTRDHLKRSSA
jgi:hypothetical protein